MSSRKSAQSTAAELSLVHLRSCLVNLPTSLVSLLVNVNTPAQNVVVELSYKDLKAGGQPQSVFLGWTGMPSKRKMAPLVSRDGISGLRGSNSARDQEVASVEIDATLANTLGLSDGQKVMATIHVDPPQVHTINFEPLTPEDWEIIELHATFLEVNLLSQVRALPNPGYKSPSGAAVTPHVLTLHLSPTSSANIKTVSLDPPPPSDMPFAKISPDSEVIVAPKTRPKTTHSSSENRSVASTSKSRRSGASTSRRRSSRAERKSRVVLRGLDRTACNDWFDEEATSDFSVWVDLDVILSRGFKGVNYVLVTILRETSAQSTNAQKQQPEDPTQSTFKVATKVIANLRVWDDPPDSKPAALSSPLCAALGVTGMVGGIVEIEPASPPLEKNAVQKLSVFPFAASSKANGGLRFGAESKAEKEEAAKTFRSIYSQRTATSSLLSGPVTDGMLFGVWDGLESLLGWEGGVVKFEPPAGAPDPRDPTRWAVGLSDKIAIEFQPPIPRPSWVTEEPVFEPLPSYDGLLVSIDKLLGDLQTHLSNLSCTLLTGASGSGKTSVARYAAQRLRQDGLFHTSYFSCKKLVNDESRMAAVRGTLTQIFMAASWGAKSGGRSLIILDDLDTSCPTETELQVGNDNGRSRQVSEIVSSLTRQFCGPDSGVVVLATAEGKESLNDTIVGSNVFREVLELKSPNKEARRQVLQAIIKEDSVPAEDDGVASHNGSRPTTADGNRGAEDSAWMDGASQGSADGVQGKPGRFVLDQDLDFLDIAGLTDGYMPKDLSVVVERAQNEAIIRSVSQSTSSNKIGPIHLGRADFDNALKDFTPTSLRNVSLQSSTTTFSSIGGLQETRQVLLETLLYPTKYAPVFEKCPLRLRSGLLLYGYPGCGKTLLASAVAGECGLNFISVKGPEILNKYIGASEKSVRDLFERASAAKPSVLFFDEFDSIAPKRGHDSTGVTDRVVNQLLTLMDGAEGLSGVYVLAATSRPDLIDPALLRPGRLDKSLLCGLPTLEDRVDILKALSQKVKLGEEMANSDEAWTEIAKRCESFSGADLQGLISNAQLEAIHDVLQEDGTEEPKTNGKTNGVNKSAAVPSFVQFPYREPEESSRSALGQPSQLVENAAIRAKLENIKQARKRNKRALQPEATKAAVEDKEVIVGWKHLIKALDGTKASISSDERNRLRRIYHEFVVGRSGDMKDGQGSMEIGGRSSLM